MKERAWPLSDLINNNIINMENQNNKEKPNDTEAKKPRINKTVLNMLIVLFVGGAIGGGIYWYITQQTIYIDKSEIDGSQIDLSPETPGVLEETMVNVGDMVSDNTVVARVGDELINAKTAGLIIAVNNNIGKIFNPGQAVVSMIDPATLRVVGHLDENKGLDEVQIGQKVNFTVDAFGSKQYSGVVDEISPTSDQSSVVFNISDTRQIKQFDVKVRFNVDAYPELKNGMSAKMWIYKK